jgi:hypothetical protein
MLTWRQSVSTGITERHCTSTYGAIPSHDGYISLRLFQVWTGQHLGCAQPRSSGGYEVPYQAGNRTPVAQGAYSRYDNYSFLNCTFVILAAVTMEQGVLRKMAGTNRTSRFAKTLQVIRCTLHSTRPLWGFNSVLA